MSPYKDLRVAQTFGGITLFVTCQNDVKVEVFVADGPLLEVMKRGLERLSGQGKVDEQLRSMCHCVGNVK